MYTRPQNSSAGKILPQPNQPPRTENPKTAPPVPTNCGIVSQNDGKTSQNNSKMPQNEKISAENEARSPQNENKIPADAPEKPQNDAFVSDLQDGETQKTSPLPPTVPTCGEVERKKRSNPRYKAMRSSKKIDNNGLVEERNNPKSEIACAMESTFQDTSTEQPFKSCDPSPPPSHQSPPSPKSGLSALLDGYKSDEILILAIIILLVMQGSDDILVLALCYIVL